MVNAVGLPVVLTAGVDAAGAAAGDGGVAGAGLGAGDDVAAGVVG